METNRNLKKPGVFQHLDKITIATVLTVIVTWSAVSAYDQYSTHPALTDQIAKYYNYIHADNPNYPKLTDRQISWMKQGAIEEDAAPRWINHFFDPIHNKAWDGSHYGNLTKEEGYKRGTETLIKAPKSALTSKDWAVNQEYQATYGAQFGNQTWQRAIDEYLRGSEKEAFIALGHALHLLEDAGVPDHTRNDSHPGLEGDSGSPLESYAEELTKNNPPLFFADYLTSKQIQPYRVESIQSAIEKMAIYSNKNYFSQDTISNQEFANPNISAGKEIIVNTSSGDKITILQLNNINLAKIKNYDVFLGTKSYTTGEKEFVLRSYVNNLFPEILKTGAGVVNLFYLDAGKQYYNLAPSEQIVADQKIPFFQWVKEKIIGFGVAECDQNSESCKPNIDRLIIALNTIDDLKTSITTQINDFKQAINNIPYVPDIFKPATGTLSIPKSSDATSLVFGAVENKNAYYNVETSNISLPFITNTPTIGKISTYVLPNTNDAPGTAGYSSTLYASAPAVLAGNLNDSDKNILTEALRGIGIDNDPANAAAMALLLTTAVASLGYVIKSRLENGVAVFDIVKTVPRTIYENIVNTTNVMTPVTRTVVDYVTVPVSEWYSRPVQIIKSVVDTAYVWVQEAVPIIKQVARTVYDYVTSWIPEKVQSWIGGIWQTITSWVEKVIPIAKTVYDTVVETAHNWVKRPIEVIKQIIETVYETGVRMIEKTVPMIREVVEYVSTPVASVYQRAKTVYDEVVVGTVSAKEMLSVAALTAAEEVPVTTPVSTTLRVPPNLFSDGKGGYWMLSGGLSDFPNGGGGVARPVADPERVREIYGDMYIPVRTFGVGSSGWDPVHGGGTSGGAMTLDQMWRQLGAVFNAGTAAQKITDYAAGKPGTGHQMGWTWQPVEMIDPKTNIIYSVDFTEDVKFQDQLGWRRTNTGLFTSEQLNNAVRSYEAYDKIENYLAHKPYVGNLAVQATGTGQPTAFQIYFKEQLSIGRTAEEILGNNPFMVGGALYSAPPNVTLDNYSYFDVPFKAGLTQAQRDSIQHMLRTRSNQGWGLNETDSKNFAFAIGVQNWQQFVGVSPANALALSRPQKAWSVGTVSANLPEAQNEVKGYTTSVPLAAPLPHSYVNDPIPEPSAWDKLVIDVGNGGEYMYQSSSFWKAVMDHPITTGIIAGVAGAAVAVVGAGALSALSSAYFGGAGTACIIFCNDVATVATQATEVTNLSSKILSQMSARGWDTNYLNSVINNPFTTRVAQNKATGNMATALYTQDGAYVVIDNVTKEIIQISNRFDLNWIPDSTIINPYLPN